MNKVFLGCALLCAIACSQPAPKTETVEVTKTVTTAADSTRGTADWAGPDVELLRKLVKSAEKGDFDAVLSCFADSARVLENKWAVDSTSVLISQAIAAEKADRVNWENVSYGEPILEVVTLPTGEKYGHIWARFTAKQKKSGKNVDVPFFASYQIKDGKLLGEWILFDSKKLQ